MKIIVLKGGANSGKTSTMRLVHAMLCVGKDYWKNLTDLKNGDKDFECVFDYEGRKVAIYSMGDYERGMKKVIGKYEGEVVMTYGKKSETVKCDVLIWPVREEIYNKHVGLFDSSKTKVIDKTVDEEFMGLANEYDAKRIIQVLNCMTHDIRKEEK